MKELMTSLHSASATIVNQSIYYNYYEENFHPQDLHIVMDYTTQFCFIKITVLHTPTDDNARLHSALINYWAL